VAATLYRDAALADGMSAQLRVGVSVLVSDDRIVWIRPGDGEEDPGDAEIVDASGATIVPAMVDCHSHITMPGGAHWIERGTDPPEELLRVAEQNGELQVRSGVRWARDVGAPRGADPVDGRERALSLGVRDRWRGRRDRPYVRAAGTWVTRRGTLPPGLDVEVDDGDGLLAAALQQLDEGADLVKLYLDGPDRDVAPFTADEVARVVDACHQRGAKVAAHATLLPGARVCAQTHIDSIEHGMQLDADVCRLLAEHDTAVVSTLTVLRSWRSFATTTTLPRFASDEGRAALAAREEAAMASIALAHRSGVRICAGTDFGGGSARANQMPWEVEALVDAGLEPWEALGAATWRGGELLDEPDAGRLREGGPADFFLVHGDPLSDPSALWRVWRVPGLG
jgi:imidazolonepropionase-like amidohydrolase